MLRVSRTIITPGLGSRPETTTFSRNDFGYVVLSLCTEYYYYFTMSCIYMAVFGNPLNTKAEIIIEPPYPFCGRPVPVPGTNLRQQPSRSSMWPGIVSEDNRCSPEHLQSRYAKAASSIKHTSTCTTWRYLCHREPNIQTFISCTPARTKSRLSWQALLCTPVPCTYPHPGR